MQRRKGKSYIRVISAIHRSSQAYVGERLKPYGLDKGQWCFLTRLLFGGDGLTQEELSEVLQIDKSNTARAMKILETQGYVRRETDPRDARKKLVYVTEKALADKLALHEINKEFNAILAEGFTAEEKEQAFDLLSRMGENLKRYAATQERGNNEHYNETDRVYPIKI